VFDAILSQFNVLLRQSHMQQKNLRPGLTIVVPVYNEEESLPRLVSALTSFSNEATFPCDVLFVNDGSADESLSLLQDFCASNDKLRFISFTSNCGLSAAIKAGFDYSDSEWTGYMDADLQTTPEDFEKLWAARDEYDLVTGIRAKRDDSFIKKFSSKFANSFRRAFTNDGIADTGCPLKIIKTDVAQRIPMFKGLHRFLPAMVLLQDGKIHQMEVRHFPREDGQSKFNVANRFFGPLADCFAYLWMKRKYINYEVDNRYDS